MVSLIRFGLAVALLNIVGMEFEAPAEENCCFHRPLQPLTYTIEYRPLYLLPSSNDLSYAVEADSCPLPSTNLEIHEIKPDYHFGFGLELGILFCESNSKLSINWDHFQSSDHSSKRMGSSNRIGPFFEIGPDASFYSKAKGKAKFEFDSLHIDYGIFLTANECLQANLYAGINVAKVNQKLSSKFSNYNHKVKRSESLPSKFSGIGPELGIDFAYRFWDMLQFTWGARAALLVGRHKNHTTNKSISPTLANLEIIPNLQRTTSHGRTQLVPAFEGKLGLSYAFTFFECFYASIEGGYEAKVYISAIQSTDIGSEVMIPPLDSNASGVYSRTFRKTLNNFSLSGPYLSFNVVF